MWVEVKKGSSVTGGKDDDFDFGEENEERRRENIFIWVCSHADFVRVSAEDMITQRFCNGGRREEKIFVGAITCRFCLSAGGVFTRHGVFLEQKRDNGEEQDEGERTFTEDNSFCCSSAEKKEGRKMISLL